MTAHKTLQPKTVGMLALMLIAGSTGDILLSKGVKQIGELQHWTPDVFLPFLVQVLTNGTVWLGISFLIVCFISYMLLLSWADYSFVMPASALTYVLVPVLARIVLNESVTPLRWAGVSCICLGVVLVGLTPPSTTTAHPDSAAGQS